MAVRSRHEVSSEAGERYGDEEKSSVAIGRSRFATSHRLPWPHSAHLSQSSPSGA
jgi:hypothetical protein